MAEAMRKFGIFKTAGCQTFRHSFAARLLDNGTHQRGIQSPADIQLAESTNVLLLHYTDLDQILRNS